MAACMHPLEEFVELPDVNTLPAGSFIPSSVEYGIKGAETILDEYLSQEEETKATGLDFGAVAKELFSTANARKVVSYIGTYKSTDQYGNPVTLSGRIVLPANGEVKRLMIMNHYTIASNAEAPSVSFPFECITAADGIGMIVPDYLGYGITADRVHPYLVADLTARNVLDMFFASLPFLDQIGRSPVNDDIFIYGYSQGGATAMEVLRYIEKHHGDLKVRLCMAGGGPYDICATYDKLITDDNTAIPYAVPLIIQGMDVGCFLNLNYEEYFKPRLLENFDEWINSKKYQNAQITNLIGTHKLRDILTEDAMNKRSPSMSRLYRAMMDNSLLNDYNWRPKTPCYVFHSMDDNVVPYLNLVRFAERYNGECNVTTNVGHYGSHVMGAVHFLFSTRSFLKEHNEI